MKSFSFFRRASTNGLGNLIGKRFQTPIDLGQVTLGGRIDIPEGLPVIVVSVRFGGHCEDPQPQGWYYK